MILLGNHDDLIGRKIVAIKEMHKSEFKERRWGISPGMSCTILVLDNGDEIYATCDSEGNGPGTLLHRYPNGEDYIIG